MKLLDLLSKYLSYWPSAANWIHHNNGEGLLLRNLPRNANSQQIQLSTDNDFHLEFKLCGDNGVIRYYVRFGNNRKNETIDNGLRQCCHVVARVGVINLCCWRHAVIHCSTYRSWSVNCTPFVEEEGVGYITKLSKVISFLIYMDWKLTSWNKVSDFI